MTQPLRHHKSDWQISVTDDELVDILAVLHSLYRRETGSAIVWLTKVPNGPRLWVIRDRSTITWVTAEGAPTDPTFALPIPESFIVHLMVVAGAEGKVNLYCNDIEGTIVGESSERMVVVDHPTGVEFSSDDMPYRHQVHGRHDQPAVATIAMDDLQFFCMSSHYIPRGFSPEVGQFYPYVSIALENNKLAWTSDWRRQGFGRTTGVVPARTSGSVSTSFFPYTAARIIQAKDPEPDARIFIDGPDAEYVYFIGEGWGIRVDREFEEVAHWRKSLVDGIVKAGYELDPHVRNLPQNQIAFTAFDSVCFASIHLADDGLTEIIRLTNSVCHGVEESLDVLSHLNRLNRTLFGARITLRDDEVRVVSEFPSQDMASIETHLSQFVAAVREIGDADCFLPLFAVMSANVADQD